MAKGTFVADPTSWRPGDLLPNGYTTLKGETPWDGDLVGTEFWVDAFSPADGAGVITMWDDSTFTGTLVGVGDGTFSWHQAEGPVDAGGVEPSDLVGVSGVFEGMTGTITWVRSDDGRQGTYECILEWA